jgi:hypothetical protein
MYPVLPTYKREMEREEWFSLPLSPSPPLLYWFASGIVAVTQG